MNTISLETKKDTTSKKDDEAAVFVLSPHLLQQLGINLESIDCPPNHPTILEGNDESVTNKKSNYSESGTDKGNYSSILETACLIKNTVLLSPTFIPTIANTIPGEVEIANINKESENIEIYKKKYDTGNIAKTVSPKKKKKSHIEKNIIKQGSDRSPQIGMNDNLQSDSENEYSTNETTEPTNQLLQGVGICVEKKREMFINDQHENVYCNDLELNISSETVFHIPISNITSSDSRKKNCLEKTKDEMSNDILHDNVISSDCSNLELNGSLLTLNHTPQSNVSSCDLQKNKPDEMNTISEQNYDSSNFKELDSLTSPPVAINSKMSSSTNNNINYSITHETQAITGEISDITLSSLNTNGKKNVGDNTKKTMVDDKSYYSDTSSTAEGVFTLAFYDDAQQNKESVCFEKTLESNIINRDNVQVKTIDNNSNPTYARDIPKYLKNKDDSQNFENIEGFHGNNNNRDSSKTISNTPEKDDLENNLCTVSDFGFIQTLDLVMEREIDNCSNRDFDKEYESSHVCISDQTINSMNHNKYISNGSKEDILDPVNSSKNIVAVQEKQHGILKSPCNKHLIPLNSPLKESIKPSENTNSSVDKVEEIAEYLSKFVNNYPSSKKLRKERNNGKSLKTKPNVTESKLCIQGVEKPGGLQKSNEHKDLPVTLKTYKRNKQRQTTLANIGQFGNKMLLNDTTEAHEIDIHTIHLPDTLKSKEFCVCVDFGQLSYYDSDTLYEHIHFWNHKKIDCNPDIIRSVYDDNFSCETNNTILDETKLEEKNIDSYQHNICWNDLDLYCDYFGVDIGLNSVVSSGETEFDVDSRKTLEKNKESISEANVEILNNNFKTVIQNLIAANQLKDTEIDFDNEKLKINNQDIVSELNDGFQHNIDTLVHTKMNILETASENLGSCFKINNAKSPPTIECIELDSCSQFIDKGETSACMTNEDGLSIDANTDEDAKNNDSQVTLPVIIEIIDDVQIQCEIGRSALTKDKINSSIKKADQKTSVSKHVEYSNMDIIHTHLAEEKEKIAKKRKSDSPRDSTNNDSTPDKQCKKNIKCGVCDQLQSKAQWDDHVENEHCFIAWKADQTINLNDAELFQKLKQKLKTVGELKCTFCGNKNKFLKNFLSHVQKCIKTKGPSIERLVKCGVCKKELTESTWMKHKAEHNYVAWKDSEPPIELEDENALKEYLMEICRENGGLICCRCGLNRKYVKLYLDHVKNCTETKVEADTSACNPDMNKTNNQDTETRSSTGDRIMKCGVCQVNIKESKWIKHIGNKHNYLAWVDGTPPINTKDDLEVHKHLSNISKQNGGLNCSKCGITRKYVKAYLQHIQICGEYTTSIEEVSVNDLVGEALSTIFEKSIFDTIENNPQGTVLCGVCQRTVPSSDWITHIQRQHIYKAWIEGQPVLDVNNDVMVRKYLNVISKRIGGLICRNCGTKKDKALFYLKHMEKCKSNLKNNIDDDNWNAAESPVQYKVEIDISPIPVSQQDNIFSDKDTCSKSNEYQCAICFINVKRSAWDNHAMKYHYNLAWPVGGTPIDLKKPYVVEKYLKEYKRLNNLVCKVCGISRASCVGFYAHILVCGKTEEEVNKFKEHCEICNNSYLCIYKSQHMTMHREQEYAKERKIKNEEEQAKKKTEETESPSGRRRAAEKARNVIEKYNTNLKEASHTCPSCKIGMDSKEELANHNCVGKSYLGYSSDSDVSVKLEQCSDNDKDDVDDDELVESDDDASNEEEEVVENNKKKQRQSLPPPPKIPRIPFKVSDPETYLEESSKEFYETHFTSEVLFNEWRNCEYELVPECEISKYLPPLEKSCKVKFGIDSWTTYERFEARHQKGWCLFAGACIQCIRWVPPPLAVVGVAGDSSGHYLAIACHSRGDVDVPRYNFDQLAQHSNAIQIWNMGDFKSSLPKFVFGISHGYGTVWSMDWCPSGARDLLPQTETKSEEEFRLGLLAIACSNGYAYIFSVPYPSTVSKNDNDEFYKLKPVVELRLTMNENRRIYQATSICWSPQKGHAIVVVGYADGTTAFFDLNCDSPILSSKVNNTTILYPYEDKRPQNSSITDVGVYPSTGAGAGSVVCSASVGGAGARAGRGDRAMHAHVAAARATFAPYWPAVLLAGDDYIVNLCVNELELNGGGRRLGTVRACAASWRLGRVAVHAPPLLRLMRTHPAYKEIHKPVIGLLQMVPIDRKRKRNKENDELAVTLEPRTYEAAIKKYGIEYSIINPKDKAAQQKSLSITKEQWVERFPLSDVSSMAFCHSERHQNKLAVALHAGLIFIVKV